MKNELINTIISTQLTSGIIAKDTSGNLSIISKFSNSMVKNTPFYLSNIDFDSSSVYEAIEEQVGYKIDDLINFDSNVITTVLRKFKHTEGKLVVLPVSDKDTKALKSKLSKYLPGTLVVSNNLIAEGDIVLLLNNETDIVEFFVVLNSVDNEVTLTPIWNAECNFEYLCNHVINHDYLDNNQLQNNISSMVVKEIHQSV